MDAYRLAGEDELAAMHAKEVLRNGTMPDGFKIAPALAISTGMFTGRLARVTHAYPTRSLAIRQAAAQFFGESGGRTARKARTETNS